MKVNYETMFNNAMKMIKQQKEEIELLKREIDILKGGTEYRYCSKCKTIKHKSKFGSHQYYCKICKSEYNREYRLKRKALNN